MRIDDDTPGPDETPELYPRTPPVNLLRGAELEPDNLVAVEGLDGSGKSTLAKAVARAWEARGGEAVLLRLGKSEVVAHALPRAKWLNADPVTLNLLNWTSLYHDTHAQRARFGDGRSLVLFDRYAWSVRVRGVLEGMEGAFMEPMERGLPRPARTFLVDAPPELCLERILASGRPITYFEAGARDTAGPGEPMVERSSADRLASTPREADLLAHLRRMRDAFLDLAQDHPRVTVVSNDGAPEEAVRTILRDLGV
jgi:thymidylate kinase